MPSIAPPRFKWEELPCTPYTKNRAFSIYVPECELNPTLVLPDLGVTWQNSPDWVRTVQSVNSPLRGYILRMHTQAGEGRVFTYARELTPVEQTTPFFTNKERRQQYWPTVLNKLWFEVHTDKDGQDHILDRIKHRVGNTYPTTILTKEFFSDVPWSTSRFKNLHPITDTVSFNFLSIQGSIPECLHPNCQFPSFQTSGKVLFGAGTTETEIGSDLTYQEFPATTMQDWEEYTLEIQTIRVLGMYHYIATVLQPPIDDREETA